MRRCSIPNTFTYWVLNQVDTTMWDGTRILAPPQFAWGTRVANPPHRTSGPSERIRRHRRHQLHPRHAQPHLEREPDQGARASTRSRPATTTSAACSGAAPGNVTGNISFANDANNPLDTTFGFANAAIGVFSTYAQTSRWAEGAYLAVNHEAFVQDNWRVKQPADARLRRAVRPHAAAVRLRTATARTSCPRSGARAQAPRLYVAGCVEQRLSVRGREPPGDGSGDRSDARAELGAGDRHARAEHRHRPPTACSRRAGPSPRPTTPIRRSA